MNTMEKLKEYGANTEEGLVRCCNMEDFYLKMIRIFLMDENFEKLEKALDEKDLDTAFEAAHALKGVCGNLSLDPMSVHLCAIVDSLRLCDRETKSDVLFEKIMADKDLLTIMTVQEEGR